MWHNTTYALATAFQVHNSRRSQERGKRRVITTVKRRELANSIAMRITGTKLSVRPVRWVAPER